jgi:hypothetical protein
MSAPHKKIWWNRVQTDVNKGKITISGRKVKKNRAD